MSAGFSAIGVIAETERLVIRPWRLDEADRYLDLYGHPEVICWFPPGPTPTRQQAVQRIERNRAEIAHDPRFGRWAAVDRATGTLTDPVNRRSNAVCKRIGMRLLGITNRWYHEPHLMFWIGARDGQQPSLSPHRPAPART